ncbi:metal-dependent phosphohydrolase [Streptomyces sp. DSM 44917]|uniref:Metal-dependent phosphohydrolase n=1 Tax=Streptomyces boetiae TaxID=3075541 RepID=A0ABU2L1L4_9ACTN|nr:metal-dependent phosphohydrolase [Streptomyces sp. DSM 44917]MDT0305451.1 metal-dependent phosphohydrolase [Streptomyces sp. DSM 44917]
MSTTGGTGGSGGTGGTGEEELLRRFLALPGPGVTAVAGQELVTRWAEPHRRYHTTAHLRAVLDRLAEPGLRAAAADPAAVELAAWFHDAVYDPTATSGDNEERSAVLAERLLAGDPRREEVARLVRLTAGHDPAEDDANGAALCDADLAVLAGTPEQYAAYAAAVRQEYGFVPDEAFREGRAAVLRGLLAQPRLFRTAYGAERWEAAARFNARGELRLLTA